MIVLLFREPSVGASTTLADQTVTVVVRCLIRNLGNLEQPAMQAFANNASVTATHSNVDTILK